MKCKLTLTLPLLVLAGLLVGGCSREAKLSKHVARGDDYFQKDEFSKAEIEYLNALRLSPKDASITRKLATLYYEQGRSVSAMRALLFVRQSHPNDVDLRFKTANLLLSLRDYTGARKEALFVATNQPTNASALLILAEASFAPADIAQSRSVLGQVSQSPGAAGGAQIALASLDVREKNFAAAEARLKQVAPSSVDPSSLNLALGKLRLAQTNLAEAETLLKRAADAAPVRSMSRVQWIDFRLSRGDIATAKEAAEEITRKCPDFIPPWLRLAEIALLEKRFEDCNTITKKVLGLDGSSFEALLSRARMWAVQDKGDKAIEELTRLDSLYPTNALVQFELAGAHLRAGKVPKAMALLDESLRIDPRFAKARLMRADLDLRTGNLSSAASGLTALLRERPEMEEATRLLAHTYALQGRRDDAIKLYRQMVARNPNNPEPSTLLGLLLRDRDSKGARAAFEKSLEIKPSYIPAIEQLVDLDIRATNLAPALARANALANSQSNSAVGLLMLAKVHAAARDLKATEAALEKAAEREPDSIAVYSMMAALYYEQKDFDKSIEKLAAITSRNPKAASTWMQKGLIYQLNNKLDKAVESYRQAVTINGSFVAALNNLAVLLSEDPKKLDEAADFAAKAHQTTSGTNAYVADTLGWILYKRGDFNNARRLLSESAAQVDNAEIHYHLAMTEYALGDEKRSRERFTKSLQPSLPPQLRPDAEARLNILNINADTATPAQIATLETAIKKDAADFVALSRLAVIYQKQGKTDQARTLFQKAARANPQSGVALNGLAQVYASTDPSRALQYAKDARKLSPADPAIAATLGSLAIRTRDFSGGSSLLQEAIRAGYTTPEVQYDLAAAQFALGRIPEAKAALNSLMNITDSRIAKMAQDSSQLMDRSNPEKRASIAQARLKSTPDDIFAQAATADLQETQKRYSDAAKSFENVVQASPDFWPGHKHLAFLYATHLSDEKRAYAHAAKARQLSPADADLTQLLGRLSLNRGELPDAVRLLEESTRANPTNAESFYLLGLANYKLKRTNDCKAAFSKALNGSLTPEMASEAKRMMASLK